MKYDVLCFIFHRYKRYLKAHSGTPAVMSCCRFHVNNRSRVLFYMEHLCPRATARRTADVVLAYCALSAPLKLSEEDAAS
eukprot:scaffold19503_cov34-Prasinocladus_malaysianus.AAC.1